MQYGQEIVKGKERKSVRKQLQLSRQEKMAGPRNYIGPAEVVRVDSGSNFEGKNQCPLSLNMGYEKKNQRNSKVFG